MKTTTPRLSNWNLINHLLHNQWLTGQERFLAMVIALHRNTTTGACHPSQRTLAEITQLPKTTVVRLVRSLVRKQVMMVGRMDHHHKAPSWFSFTFDQHVLDFIGPHFGPQTDADGVGPRGQKNAKSGP